MTADPRIDRWLGKDRPWRNELARLRVICLSEGLVEALKWRLPCYAVPGKGNVAILQNMKAEVRLAFFKGVLLDDPCRRLVSAGENSRHGRHLAFRSVGEIDAAEETVRGFLRQAVALEEAGRRVETSTDDLDLPDELTDALGDDAELAAGWDALTPGRRRGWTLHFAGAKQSATRARRIGKARDAILDGKGWNEP